MTTGAEGATTTTTREISDAIVRACAIAGSRFGFGVPGGGSNLDTVGALEAEGLRFVLTHTEFAAAIMAGVVGELTGAPGICVTTRGPGAASAVNGVAQALLDRQPMVIITDCVAALDRERISHQRLDQIQLFRAVAKASTVACDDRDEVASAIVAVATSGRPGPVHIDLDPTGRASEERPTTQRRGAPFATWSKDVEELIRAATRPVLLVGLGATAGGPANRSKVFDQLARLGAATDVPMLCTYKGAGMVRSSAPWFAGLLTGATIEAPILSEADLVIGIGLDPVELIPAPWAYPSPVVLLSPWPVDSTFFGDNLRAEIKGPADELLVKLQSLVKTSWPPHHATAVRRAAATALARTRPEAADGVAPHEVVECAARLAPAGSLATVDAGAHMLLAMSAWPAESPSELLISSGLATMGFALPAAIAAALVSDRTVTCLTGDGGLGMVMAELETLAREQLPVVVVVFNDSTLSLIQAKQSSVGQGGNGAVTYRRVDFAAAAAGLGVRSWSADDSESYASALSEAYGSRQPALIDVRVDPSCYRDVLTALRGTSPTTRVLPSRGHSS